MEIIKMTLCEFYKQQFDKAKATQKHFEADSKYCSDVLGFDEGSFGWFKCLSERYFGGGYSYEYESVGITRQQLNEAKEKGFVKYSYCSNWQARKLNQTEYWSLTNKGLKALYKAFQSEW
jgi:hypothetical protein